MRLRLGRLPHLVRHHWSPGRQGSAPLGQQAGLAQDQDAGLRAAAAGMRPPERKGGGPHGRRAAVTRGWKLGLGAQALMRGFH